MGWGCYRHEVDAGSVSWKRQMDLVTPLGTFGRDGEICPFCWEELLTQASNCECGAVDHELIVAHTPKPPKPHTLDSARESMQDPWRCVEKAAIAYREIHTAVQVLETRSQEQLQAMTDAGATITETMRMDPVPSIVRGQDESRARKKLIQAQEDWVDEGVNHCGLQDYPTARWLMAGLTEQVLGFEEPTIAIKIQ